MYLKKWIYPLILLNLMFSIYAYGFLGFAAPLVISYMIYYFMENIVKYHKSEANENLAFMVFFIMGVFAVNKAFGMPILTIATGVIETIAFLSFALLDKA